MELKKHISSRYVRRDSKNYFQQMPSNTNRNNIIEINLTENNIKNNKLKKQLSHYMLRTDYNRSKISQMISMHKSPSQIISPKINKKDNVSMIISNKHSRNSRNNQLNTPFITYSNNNNNNNNISHRTFQRNIKTPLINKNNNDYIKVNNLVYYLRCPYCNHELNKVENNHYKKNILENKENISENVLNNNNKYKNKTEKYSTKKTLKEEKSNHKNFYINEKGVFVFQQNDKPTKCIKIVNLKPDLSKYSNESKVLGKKNNIGIYEGPVPITKVFVRPLKI